MSRNRNETRIYLLEPIDGNAAPRLVRAAAERSALAFVAAKTWKTRKASQDDLVLHARTVEVEDAGPAGVSD